VHSLIDYLSCPRANLTESTRNMIEKSRADIQSLAAMSSKQEDQTVRSGLDVHLTRAITHENTDAQSNRAKHNEGALYGNIFVSKGAEAMRGKAEAQYEA
jgi:hypothetical protein